jgi:prepilin-type N-terminal cleavage/methylation domain-containing protein
MILPAHFKRHPGFSLVEILLTLTIMGIIAACTIPPLFKPPDSTQGSKSTLYATDAAFMIISAYEQYRQANPTVASTVGLAALTPYMTYVKLDTSTTLDSSNPGSSIVCGSGSGATAKVCLALSNGAYFYYNPNMRFNGTDTTNGFWIVFDPDGTRNNIQSLGMVLTYGGQVKTYGSIDTTYYYHTGGSTSNIAPGPTDPSWFQGF